MTPDWCEIQLTYSNHVITIKSLNRITFKDRERGPIGGPIENGAGSDVDLVKIVNSFQNYEFIRKCFNYGYYHLLSMPINEDLKRLAEPPPYSNGRVCLCLNLARLKKSSSPKKKGRVKQQDVLPRSVDIIKELIECCVLHFRGFDSGLNLSAINFNPRLFMSPDDASTFFFWLCRNLCLEKNNIPMGLIETICEEDLNAQFDAGFLRLYARDRITPKMAKRQSKVVRKLTNVIREKTNLDIELELFGSSVNMLGTSNSDLDICMTLRNDPTGKDVNCKAILKRVLNSVLWKNQDIRTQPITPILRTRVPILKFNYEGYAVDLSMYNQCAVHNSKLLRSYALIDKRFPQLFYLVKQYARSCGIACAATGSLSSYAWALMVIHFLQQLDPPILPVLQEKQEEHIIEVDGCNVWFDESFDPSSMIRNQDCLTSLFRQFLQYYEYFDFGNYVISIRTSSLMTKSEKNWKACLMAIEDPFELNYNLGRRLRKQMASYIIRSFSEAYDHIGDIQMRCLHGRPRLSGTDNFRMFFDGRAIMGCDPPIRKCGYCHEAGHRVKNCPEKLRKQSIQKLDPKLQVLENNSNKMNNNQRDEGKRKQKHKSRSKSKSKPKVEPGQTAMLESLNQNQQ